METENDSHVNDLYKGLNALYDNAFPKKCALCGRVYRSVDDFINDTVSVVSGSGLTASADTDDQPVVELFRNCRCGSTLMDCFSERRDQSETGNNRRNAFLTLQRMLVENGLTAEEARGEIVKAMNGKPKPILKRLGILIR